MLYHLHMSRRRAAWSRAELLAAFRLYCRTPFGRLHQHNPDIIALAERMGRSASSVGMKACNFASLDPAMQKRKKAGLANASRADRELWEQFLADSATIAEAAEAAYIGLMGTDVSQAPAEQTQPDAPRPDADSEVADLDLPMLPEMPEGPATVERLIRARRLQGFFRDAVLTSYGQRCALTGLAEPVVLNASHIIPHAHDHKRSADPHNGLCLNALHDRAFDRGLISFDPDLRLLLSPRLHRTDPATAPAAHLQMFLALEGTALQLPERFEPDPEALRYHRETLFAR